MTTLRTRSKLVGRSESERQEIETHYNDGRASNDDLLRAKWKAHKNIVREGDRKNNQQQLQKRNKKGASLPLVIDSKQLACMFSVVWVPL